jgi:hypothetical protein
VLLLELRSKAEKEQNEKRILIFFDLPDKIFIAPSSFFLNNNKSSDSFIQTEKKTNNNNNKFTDLFHIG